jgi:hypothetical protein
MDVESAHPPPKFTESLHSDEKFDEKHDAVEVAEPILGDVYDDIRAIDLGEDGKERPIGTWHFGLVSSVLF